MSETERFSEERWRCCIASGPALNLGVANANGVALMPAIDGD